MIRETWGWMHYAFYVAFVGLLIGTTIVAINSDVRDLFELFGLDFYFYYGDFYLYFKAAMDTFFLLLIVGVLMEGMRRARPQAHRAERTARRQDARQPREPARLLVPDVDDGADRHHRPDARRRAHQRVASCIHRMGIRGPRRRTNRRRAGRRRYLPSMAVAGARAVRVRAAVLFPVHQAASLDLRPAQSFLSQPGSARTARADQGFRKRRDLRRLAGRAVHVEATARHGIVPRMRPLHDQLSHRQHRQDAQSQVSRDRTARASARQGAVLARRQSQRQQRRRRRAPKRPRGTAPT